MKGNGISGSGLPFLPPWSIWSPCIAERGFGKMTVGTELVPGPNAVDITPTKDGGIMKEIKVFCFLLINTKNHPTPTCEGGGQGGGQTLDGGQGVRPLCRHTYRWVKWKYTKLLWRFANTICYVHNFQSRSKFDSSRDRGDQFSFNIGKSEVKTWWILIIAEFRIFVPKGD